MSARRKTAARQEALSLFQDRLLEALWNGGDARAIRRALLADPQLKEFYAYIRAMEPRMIEVAGELARKWGEGGAQAMRLLGNILWFLFCGGFFMGIAWFLFGLLAFVSIVGIPWGRACFTLGNFAFFPFGRQALSRREVTHRDDIGTGFLGTLGNIIWMLFAGLWLAMAHLFLAGLCFVTLIGIPFGIQHVKMVEVSLFPIGKTIVRID